MPIYKAPLDDMRFILHEVLDCAQLTKLKGYESADKETVNSMLEMVGQFSEEVLFPLNASGDAQGCRHNPETKAVTTPDGFQEAYAQFCENGLTAVNCHEQYGGLNMPIVLGTALGEMFCSANMSFGMYPGLSHGAYNAIYAHGSDEQKQTWLPKLASGEWAGTMCLTEPQAGTDLGLIQTKAQLRDDGSYAITGNKIFISAGDHDLTDNIVHLVLAKIDSAETPQGVRGISLFIVPKQLPEGLGNAVTCARLEEKMGIHGNATCEMQFEGAKGWLVGPPHQGMKAMFVMMNEARLGVGLQGLGLSEIAYQNAVAYALDRKQSQRIDAKVDKGAAPSPANIIEHPDVRRELLTIKAQTEAGRALAYWTAQQLDLAHVHSNKKVRTQAQACVDLLTPIVKAHLTDNACIHTANAIQVYGGHGYITEHGMEQFNRDARITRIYEGTNGIQALDFIGRKVLQKNLLPVYLKKLAADVKRARRAGADRHITSAVLKYAGVLKKTAARLRRKAFFAKLKGGDMGPVMVEAAGAATDLLNLASIVVLGHMWAVMAGAAARQLAAGGDNRDFYEQKLKTAQFYIDKIMPEAQVHAARALSGANTLMDMSEDGFIRGQGTVAT